MKKVVALRNYSDKYIVIREGMIYNLDDSIADSLIEKGVLGLGVPDDISVTPSSTTGTQIADIKVNGQSNKIYAPAGSGGDGGVLALRTPDDFTLTKTFQEIVEAIDAGKYVFVHGGAILDNNNPEYYDNQRWVDPIYQTYYSSDDQKYYIETTGGNSYRAASISDYPTYVE